MSSLVLYQASVPVLRAYLRQLLSMIDKAASHLERCQRSDRDLLRQALTPDMFDLGQQVQIAAGFALRCVAPITGLPMPDLGAGDAEDLGALRGRVALALQTVEAVGPESISVDEESRLDTVAGEATLNMSARDFVLGYAMPNFFFHLSMAYALLRQHGVPLGKPDFDGLHRYAAGFSFISR